MKLTDVLTRCIDKADSVIEIIKEDAFGSHQNKELKRKFSITQAAKMIGVSREAIRLAEKTGRIAPPKTIIKNRKVYDLSEINVLRDQFGTRPLRKKGDEPFILLFMNFKGGVRKTTISVHQAQYLALKGYKVLLIDADSQASATAMFGLTPDMDLSEDETMHGFLTGEKDSLDYCIKKTYWDGIDLIPSNLTLYDVEYIITKQAYSGSSNEFYKRLRKGIDGIKENYDFIIIDAPPSLGLISINLIYAADGIIVPMPPIIQDFCSTRMFFDLVRSVISEIQEREFKFVKLLISKNDGYPHTEAFIRYIKEVFSSDLILNSYFRDTQEIPKAAMTLQSLYEFTGAKSNETNKRALNIINTICHEIETLITSSWPSGHGSIKRAEEAMIW
ncbi:MAG: AAA family ATPase [Gammaproteobacteria bacterium]